MVSVLDLQQVADRAGASSALHTVGLGSEECLCGVAAMLL